MAWSLSLPVTFIRMLISISNLPRLDSSLFQEAVNFEPVILTCDPSPWPPDMVCAGGKVHAS